MNVVVSYFEGNANPLQVHIPHVLVKKKKELVNGVQKITLHLKLIVAEKGWMDLKVKQNHHMAMIKKQKGKLQMQVIDHDQYNQIMHSRFI